MLETDVQCRPAGVAGAQRAASRRENPVAFVSKEREHNERDRVLSPEEFARVVEAAEAWLKPMLLVAYHTGMRQGEIRSLRWDQVDLQRRLHPAQIGGHEDWGRASDPVEWGVDSRTAIGYNIPGVSVGVREPGPAGARGWQARRRWTRAIIRPVSGTPLPPPARGPR